jgi:hypothetical protein
MLVSIARIVVVLCDLGLSTHSSNPTTGGMPSRVYWTVWPPGIAILYVLKKITFPE